MNDLTMNTCNARDIKSNDYILLGNSVYRVYSIGTYTDTDDKSHTRIDLISDQLLGPASRIMIELKLHPDHLITVLQTRK